MPKVKESNKITLNPQQAKDLFTLSNKISDMTEEILEDQAIYSQEFLRGLKSSLKDAKEGKLTKIESLTDLI